MGIASIKIGNRRIGGGAPVFIIAEAGVNHNGELELAEQLIDAAAQAGADAVKFQTFRAERLVTEMAPKAAYQRQTTDPNESQLAMIRHLELPYETHEHLKARCEQRGILFMSTPFDETSADLLEKLGVPAFKIGSGDVTHWPLLEHVASKKRPIILSTGMSCVGEVDDALRVIRSAGCHDVILLHCVSNYPADPADVNLRAMQTMAAAFQRPVGYSDHTLGIEVAIGSVALGACILEKHFTLSRTLPGPDHQASLEPYELSALVRAVRNVEAALGHGRKEPAPSEANTAVVARRSMVAAQDIPAGTKLTGNVLAVKRPGTGIPPSMKPYLIGRTVKETVRADTLLSWEMLA